MARWRFYQGLRTEWRWYHVDDHGSVVAESDRGFAELQGCMANAEASGFNGEAFHVYTRQAGSFAATHAVSIEGEKSDPPSTWDVSASDGPSAA
jgi:hypothetical protein